MVEKKMVSKLTTITIVIKICKNKNFIFLDNNSKMLISINESKKSVKLPKIKVGDCFKKLYEMFKESSVAVSLIFQKNVNRISNINPLTINIV
jgi:hypothetical protein